ncbi:MAG TPA: DUF4397 domain-containing protein, partial [Acidimicrobiia bacterium]|nr:DUF4397 domain-containing protein [Acidimicrobiia bacterium]
MEIPIIPRRLLTLVVCLLGLALTSCNTGNGVGATANTTRVRVVNLVPNAAAVSVQVDNDPPLVTGLQFEQLTQYMPVTAGAREFKVSVDGGNTNIIDISRTISVGVDYTFVIYGPVEAANSVFSLDTTIITPNGGTSDLRVTNLATGIASIDLYLTAPGIDLTATAPAVRGVGFGTTTVFVAVNTADYELRVTTGGTKEVIYDASIGAFTDQSLVEAIVFGKGSAKLVNVALLNIDSNGTGQVVDSQLAEFKVMNGSSLGSPLNVLVDGVLVLTNVPFGGVSNYQVVATGSRTITVQSAATPGADLLTVLTSLDPATDTSIAISGPAGGLRSLVLADNNLPSAAGRARVRFVNASPDLAALD